MKVPVLIVALLHAVTCGNISIRMPYLNPAGVTYVDGSAHAGLAAGSFARAFTHTTATVRPFTAPAAYAAPLSYPAVAPVAYRAPAFAAPAPVAYTAPAYKAPAFAAPAPVAYTAPAYTASAPLTYAAPAPLAYAAPAVAAPLVTKYAAVPTVHHVPGVADVPVTRYEAQPAVFQKTLDVAKPAIKTRKFEIRRPAIEKTFYDIEERTIVRPAGSAVVELEQPSSKTQKGDALIHPAVHVHTIPAIPAVTAAVRAYPTVSALPTLRAAIPAVPAVAALRTAIPAVPAFRAVPAYASYASYQPFLNAGYQPFAPALSVSAPTQFQLPQNRPSQSTEQPQGTTETPYPQYEPISSSTTQEPIPSPAPVQDSPQSDDDDDSVSISNPEFARSAPTPETAEQPQPRPVPEARSVSAPAVSAPVPYNSPFDLIPQARSGPSVIPSLRNIVPEVAQSNQQKLIELLTARGNVAEVGTSRSGPAIASVGEAGQIRGRVLSATPAPELANPTNERVNTRRVVVSRPIETLQEIEVSEPVTKLERVHVQQPTFIKTARHELVRVPTSVPVYGKALAPVAHAALPAYSPYYG